MSKRRNKSLKKASVILETDQKTNLTPTDERMRRGQVSMFSLSQLNGVIYEEIKKELRSPDNKKLYKQMLNDSTIDTPYSLIEMMVAAPDWKATCPKDAPEEEVKRARMLNYMIKTTKRHWSEYIVEATSYIPFGFWVGEKVFKVIDTPDGKFEGVWDIKTVSQDTIQKWHFDRDTGEYIGVRQDLTLITHQSMGKMSGYVDLPRIKYLHLRNSPKRDNPEGRSILNSIYVIWKYKALLEEFLTIGGIKDLNGTPIFYVDAEKIAEAEIDPNSPSAKMIAQLKVMGQGMNSGDLNCMILPTAFDDRGNKLFDFDLANSGTKQVDLLPVIKHYSNQILMRFFADVLALGTDGSGSFALSDNKMSLLEIANEHHLKTIQRCFNHDLIRQIYRRNKWDYDPDKSCSFVYEKINDGDLSVISGFIQRTMAVGALRPSEQLEAFLLGLLDQEQYDELTKFLETKNLSRSGDGLEEGLPNGTGFSTSTGADRSIHNLSKDTI